MLIPPHLELTVNRAQIDAAAKAASPRTRSFRPASTNAAVGLTISPMQLIDGGIALTPTGNNWPSWIDHLPPDDLSVAVPFFQTFELAIRQWSDSLRRMLAINFSPVEISNLGLKGALAS